MFRAEARPRNPLACLISLVYLSAPGAGNRFLTLVSQEWVGRAGLRARLGPGAQGAVAGAPGVSCIRS